MINIRLEKSDEGVRESEGIDVGGSGLSNFKSAQVSLSLAWIFRRHFPLVAAPKLHTAQWVSSFLTKIANQEFSCPFG